MDVRPGYKQTDVGVIPEDWDVVTLGAIATIRDGTHQTPRYVPVGIPFYSVEHVTSRDFLNTKFISEEEHQYLTRSFKIEKGDVLMTRIGSIGECVLVDWDVKASFYVSLALLKIHGAHAPYVAAYSELPAFKKEVDLHSLPSATPKKINLGPISNVRLALPSNSDEQKVIATTLRDMDALLGGLDRLIAKKRDLRTGVMQRLLTGQTRLPGFTAPWKEKRLGELVETDPENLGADNNPNLRFNYIALEGVDRGRLLGWSEQSFASAPSRARRKLRDGDVLVATVRPNLKAHLLFKQACEGSIWVCSTGFCVLRSKRNLADPAFIFAQLFGPSIPRQIEKLIAGSNYPAINSSDVRNLMIGAPDIEEQTAIARALSDMDAEIAALEARLVKTRNLKQAMMQALLTGQVRLPVSAVETCEPEAAYA